MNYQQTLLYKSLRILALGVVVLFLLGCQSVGYYSQSVVGHTRLMLARQPVHKVIESASEEVATKLLLSQELKRFAVERLGLPDNKSYTSYVDLKRAFPVWVVVAAKPYSLAAKQWCYPVIGCAAYRGYFSAAAAQRYAKRLEDKGYETTVAGASAYSTLGWFSDPLLPTMIKGADASLAEVLFHELAHQVLYVKGQSAFNESFASLVGEQGALLWLQEQQADGLSAYRKSIQAQRDFAALIEGLKTELEGLYAQPMAEAVMAKSKSAILSKFRSRYQQLKQAWQGVGYYDQWMLKPLNNARLVAFSTYHTKLPSFEALFAACDQNFERLYLRLKTTESLENLGDCDV